MYEFVLGLNLILWAGFVAYFFSRPYASIYHPACYYLFFHGVVFTLRPIIAYARNYTAIYYFYDFHPSPEVKLTALYVAMLGLVFFMVTCLRYGDQAWRFKGGPVHDLERRQLALPVMLAFALCLPISVWSLASNLQQGASGVWDMVRDPSTGFAINTTGNGYFKDAQIMLATLGLMFAWFFRFRWWSILPLIAFVFLRAGTGARGVFMIGAASLGLAYLYHLRARWPRWWMLPAFAALMALFSQIGNDRGAEIRQFIIDGKGNYRSYSEQQARFMEGMDFANLEYLEYLIYIVPEKTGTYDYFLNNLQVFTEPIPRVLWPGKPVGAPIKLFSLFDYGNPIGMTNSMPGQGWIQLGWGGVIIWSALWGYLCALLYRWFVRGNQSNLQAITYLVIPAQLLIVFRDGTLLTLMKGSMFFLAPIALVVLFRWLLRLPGFPELAWLARPAKPSPADLRAVRAGHGVNAFTSGLTPAERRRRLAALDGQG